MTMRRLEPIVFWFTLAVALVMLLLLGAVLTGHFVPETATTTRPETERTRPAATVSQATTEEARPVVPPAQEASTTAAATRTTPSAPVEAALAGIVVRAARGDCWVEAREGSATGAVLFFGLLPEGQAKTLRARSVWLRLGAGENVDVLVDGRRMDIAPGTSDVVLTRKA